jgi:acyl-CoA synthetase (AMP-forming)/AMP-acid ligase II
VSPPSARSRRAGRPAASAPTDETIPRLLALRRRADPDIRALVSDDLVGTDPGPSAGAPGQDPYRSITFAQLDDASRALAARLVAAGVGKGDRVGLLAPNGIEWATTALAALRIGAVLVPLSTLLRPPELLAQLTTAAVTHLVTARSHRGRSYLDDLETAAPGLLAATGASTGTGAGRRHPAAPALRRVWPADALPTDAVPMAMVTALEDVVRPADDMAILFTSGSRGTPKGVVHTHAGALRATRAGLDARCVGRGERLYIPMPFFWMGGFGGGLLSVLVAGATLLTEATPEPARTIELLERERATLFRGWPDQAASLAAHPAFAGADLSSLRPGSLGAVLPPEQRPAPGARANLFGMTESFGPYAGDRLDTDLPPDKQGSCGRPFAGVEVRIAEPTGPDGEIQLRGPTLLRSICGRDRSTVFTADGWYPTGDLGRLDDDGYLWYSGRLDDMFKVKGATVYPSEVEAALRSIPGVTRAHVTDVSHDGTHQVAALVVSTLDIAAIAAATRARLSAFKVPTLWLVTPDPAIVPLSPTGKPDKPQLQELLQASGSGVRWCHPLDD